jgi:hypothetical protein
LSGAELEVPRVLVLAGRRTNGLSLELAIFSPGEIEPPTLPGRGLTINEDESWIGFSILSDNTHELPAFANSAILYKVGVFTIILTDHVLRASSIFGTADERNS